MTREEHHDIIQILTTESWQARKKMLEYMKTVKIDDTVPDVPTVEVAPETPVKLKFVNESERKKPNYPDYFGPPLV